MFTATADLMLPSTVTGSWPRPRWFDDSMWGRSLDTCMMDVRFRERFQDALAVVISDEERAGIDILTHGDFHCDEDMAEEIRKALAYIPPERLVVSTDCGFGRQGCNREIAFYKTTSIAQGCNIVREELGLPTTYVPAADPALQIDIVPKKAS